MADKKLRYVFLGDEASLLKSIRRSDTALGKFSKGITRVGSAAATGFAIVGAAATAAGVQAVKVASDANEAAAAFDETFGVAAQSAGEFVEDFANKAGLADFELKQLLATSGAVLQGINFTAEGSADLSQKLATLAGDVASFSNVQGGAEPVLQAFTKALLGERESLKTFGIAILEADVQQQAFIMTGKTSAKELTKQEKALATYELLLQKTKVQQGDLNRTQESFANVSRKVSAELKEVQANLGQELLPVASELLPIISELVEDLAEGFAPILQELAPIIQRVVDLFQVLAPVLLPLLENGFKALAKVFDIVVSVVEFGVGIFQDNNDELDKGNSLLTKYGVHNQQTAFSIYGVTQATEDQVDVEKLKNLEIQRGIAMTEYYSRVYKDQYTPAHIDARTEIEKEQDTLESMIESKREATEVARKEAEALMKQTVPALQQLRSARQKILSIQERQIEAEKQLKAAQEDLINANKDLLDIDEDLLGANDELVKANENIIAAEEAVEKAKIKAKEVTNEERLAILRQEEAVQRLTDEQDGSEIKTIELALAVERLTELRDISVGVDRNVEEAERDLADAQREAERVQERINKLLEDKEKLREREIELTEKVKDKQEDLNKAHTSNVDVLLELAAAQESYNEALAKLGDGKLEQTLQHIRDLAKDAMSNLSGLFGSSTSSSSSSSDSDETFDDDKIDDLIDDTTPGKSPPQVVKELVAARDLTRTADAARGLARAEAMGGAARFGELTINFNGTVTNPEEMKNVVVGGINEFNRTEGDINRIINRVN
jgi:hypothetical protein